MSAWSRSLDAAGIREPGLRSDYGAQRDLVARFRRSAYLAARTLLPRPLLPHVVAATAVMHHGDDLLDTGPKPRRAEAWGAFRRDVREALATGRSTDPMIRALMHTIGARPRLRDVVEEYLSTADAELEFTGFADEADYQAYLDAYSMPAFLLVGILLAPEGDDGPYRTACRTLVDGTQRLDFVNDLAEDAREGRTGVPARTLERFSVTARDIAAGRASPGVGALVRHQVEAARADLLTARELPVLTSSPYSALIGALIDIELLTADAALARGTGLLRGSAKPPVAGALRVLLGARRRARRQR
ncbi:MULTISPECIES: squalene/phytoene synthase family protein [unclassified Streptomyces]|uniref:squalene/phytoene synthase family protein n=1 Tax=unclassified Streptomyces TaxID=2593676 RepID=UPI0007DE270C|nr:squalene/phytoene synthase family protein [Streptomyces sp. SAT1]ANH95076.1 phytoene/squalene synthetase [Streptomyces sp. SAT1]